MLNFARNPELMSSLERAAGEVAQSSLRKPSVASYAMPAAHAGATGGMSLGTVLGHLSDILSAPRKMLWGALSGGRVQDAGDVADVLGLDRDSTLGTVLGNAAEIFLDPLNLGLGGLGGLVGKRVGQGLDTSLKIAQREGALGGELANIAGQKSAITGAERLAESKGFMGLPHPESPLWNKPEVFGDALPSTLPRVGADAMESLARSGHVVPTGQGRSALQVMGDLPSWAEKRGGWVKPTFEKEARGLAQEIGQTSGSAGSLRGSGLSSERYLQDAIPDAKALARDMGESIPAYGSFREPSKLSDLLDPVGAEKLRGSIGRMADAPMSEFPGLAAAEHASLDRMASPLSEELAQLADIPGRYPISANPLLSPERANHASLATLLAQIGALPPMLTHPLPGAIDRRRPGTNLDSLNLDEDILSNFPAEARDQLQFLLGARRMPPAPPPDPAMQLPKF